jgi:hypothetical protein
MIVLEPQKGAKCPLPCLRQPRLHLAELNA